MKRNLFIILCYFGIVPEVRKKNKSLSLVRIEPTTKPKSYSMFTIKHKLKRTLRVFFYFSAKIIDKKFKEIESTHRTESVATTRIAISYLPTAVPQYRNINQ